MARNSLRRTTFQLLFLSKSPTFILAAVATGVAGAAVGVTMLEPTLVHKGHRSMAKGILSSFCRRHGLTACLTSSFCAFPRRHHRL